MSNNVVKDFIFDRVKYKVKNVHIVWAHQVVKQDQSPNDIGPPVVVNSIVSGKAKEV